MAGIRRWLFGGASALCRTDSRLRPKEATFEALSAPVTVRTDKRGIPHIFAKNTDDLFFAQGYVTARDRLFQIDYTRHAARGRICEVVGRKKLPWRELTVHLREKDTFDVDVMMRTFGLERVARDSLALHSSHGRHMLECYAQGVNAFLQHGARPLEHRLLKHHAPPWEALDSLVTLMAIGFELNFAWRTILLGQILHAAKVPEEIARKLWPAFPEEGPSIIDEEAYQACVKDLLGARDAAEDAGLGYGDAAGVGSNCFVVGPDKTHDKNAWMCNDTHLAMVAPCPWHEIALHSPELELHGFALAGAPGVGIGRTPHHTWGITAGLVHDLDLFVERIDPEDASRYLTPDGYAPLFVHDEAFRIKGEGTKKRPIYESRHGPLLETVASPIAAQERLAVCWTAHRPNRAFDALVGIWEAQSFEDFRAAASRQVCPTFNLSYADRDGNIGYVLAGDIPKRRARTPLRPLEGWTTQWDWKGVVPAEENPWEYNPPRGFIVTANNRVAPRSFPHELGQLFEPPERFETITKELSERASLTHQDLQALQNNTRSTWALRMRDVLARLCGGFGSWPTYTVQEREALKLWRNWDGDATANSSGAAIAMTVPSRVAWRLLVELAGEAAARAFLELGSFAGGALVELEAMADRLEADGLPLPPLIRDAFKDALCELERQTGTASPQRWRWGDVHYLECRHRLHHSPVGPLFSLGPVEGWGGPDTVNRGDIEGVNDLRLKVGPAMRFIANAADARETYTALAGGQSGLRTSRFCDDQLEGFAQGKIYSSPTEPQMDDIAYTEEWSPT